MLLQIEPNLVPKNWGCFSSAIVLAMDGTQWVQELSVTSWNFGSSRAQSRGRAPKKFKVVVLGDEAAGAILRPCRIVPHLGATSVVPVTARQNIVGAPLHVWHLWRGDGAHCRRTYKDVKFFVTSHVLFLKGETHNKLWRGMDFQSKTAYLEDVQSSEPLPKPTERQGGCCFEPRDDPFDYSFGTQLARTGAGICWSFLGNFRFKRSCCSRIRDHFTFSVLICTIQIWLAEKIHPKTWSKWSNPNCGLKLAPSSVRFFFALGTLPEFDSELHPRRRGGGGGVRHHPAILVPRDQELCGRNLALKVLIPKNIIFGTFFDWANLWSMGINFWVDPFDFAQSNRVFSGTGAGCQTSGQSEAW